MTCPHSSLRGSTVLDAFLRNSMRTGKREEKHGHLAFLSNLHLASGVWTLSMSPGQIVQRSTEVTEGSSCVNPYGCRGLAYPRPLKLSLNFTDGCVSQ